MYDRNPRGGQRGPQVTDRNVRATVKWFNATKGFGFASLDDGSDAFLHVTALAGEPEPPEGATLICDVGQGPKGPQIVNVYSVDTSTAAPARAPRGPAGPRPDRSGPTEEVVGTVKWYNATKGFGFVTPDQGSKDVFVHANALRRSGMADLADGARVRMAVRQGAKGPEAERVEAA